MGSNDQIKAGTEETRATVQGFFQGFVKGDMVAVFALLDPAIEYTVNTRNTVTREAIPWSTTFHGAAEVQAFFGRLMQNFDVLAFDLESILADGTAAAAFGHFRYRVKSTGLECATDWCARFTVNGGKITHYQFFEDSYAIARAFRREGHWQLALDEGVTQVPGGL